MMLSMIAHATRALTGTCLFLSTALKYAGNMNAPSRANAYSVREFAMSIELAAMRAHEVGMRDRMTAAEREEVDR